MILAAQREGHLLAYLDGLDEAAKRIQEVEEWESQIREYEGSTNEQITPNIRSATVLNGLPQGNALCTVEPPC